MAGRTAKAPPYTEAITGSAKASSSPSHHPRFSSRSPAPQSSGGCLVAAPCLARTENATFEFDPADTELSPPCYPIESVTKFELKTTEADGWQEQTGVDYLIRSGAVISLSSPSSFILHPSSLGRISYTGGYVLPGTTPQPGQTPLPDDLERACVEQVAYWFTNRERLGLKTYWPSGAAYQQFATQDLLESVQAVLARHRRWSI